MNYANFYTFFWHLVAHRVLPIGIAHLTRTLTVIHKPSGGDVPVCREICQHAVVRSCPTHQLRLCGCVCLCKTKWLLLCINQWLPPAMQIAILCSSSSSSSKKWLEYAFTSSPYRLIVVGINHISFWLPSCQSRFATHKVQLFWDKRFGVGRCGLRCWAWKFPAPILIMRLLGIVGNITMIAMHSTKLETFSWHSITFNIELTSELSVSVTNSIQSVQLSCSADWIWALLFKLMSFIILLFLLLLLGYRKSLMLPLPNLL